MTEIPVTDTMADTAPRHADTLNAALQACASRHHWSPFAESPSTKIHGAERPAEGKARFEALLGEPFDLEQPGTIARTGREISPYTQAPLGVDYPKSDPDALFAAARAAMDGWKRTDPDTRADLCIEMAFALDEQAFVNAHATMHTAGQSYLMAFSGSGANALDRGLEAVAYAYRAITDVPARAEWQKTFGRAGPVRLRKTYRALPRGVAVVACCATFPLWNAYPAIFANLMTGNPVIVKPHPNGVLPVALAVRRCREVLNAAGHNPDLVLLAADTAEEPITVPLLKHPDCAIIDYTGSQRFGAWIEAECASKKVYTETAGCNGVVIHSTGDAQSMIDGLANGICGFSAQMCTSPQNIHIPADGVEADGRRLSFDEVVERLTGAIAARTGDARRAAGLCAAIQAPATLDLIAKLQASESDGAQLRLASHPYEHPDFPNARTATPLILETDPAHADLYGEEHFGPVAFVIREESAQAALANAARLAHERGAISSYLYSADETFTARAQDAFADAGASLWCNMPASMPINFAAAYSDYHVTGLNPAGNACLTDLAFVADRFRIVQFREPIPAKA
ncbi:MAG: phenylacetic acid degradation protein PaaN [Caulobacterales bacterium]|nr:phenylacetic acid degradation protein PaaN [Caulobacterales bacterium]